MDQEVQRLDKWLWAARLFKTRRLASDAISGGKVHVDGQRVKPSRRIHVNSLIRVHKRNFDITLIVERLTPYRRPAEEARQLYRETEESQQQRQQKKEALAQQTTPRRQRRPGKHERRLLTKIKRTQIE